MKKKIFIAVSIILLAALGYGLKEFYRTPTKANEMSPVYEGPAKAFVENIDKYKSGEVIKLMDTIQSVEKKSITLPFNTIVHRDSTDTKNWPKKGYIEVQGFYHGIIIEDFFGDTTTLIHIGGAFLLNSDDSEDLN